MEMIGLARSAQPGLTRNVAANDASPGPPAATLVLHVRHGDDLDEDGDDEVPDMSRGVCN